MSIDDLSIHFNRVNVLCNKSLIHWRWTLMSIAWQVKIYGSPDNPGSLQGDLLTPSIIWKTRQINIAFVSCLVWPRQEQRDCKLYCACTCVVIMIAIERFHKGIILDGLKWHKYARLSLWELDVNPQWRVMYIKRRTLAFAPLFTYCVILQPFGCRGFPHVWFVLSWQWAFPVKDKHKEIPYWDIL